LFPDATEFTSSGDQYGLARSIADIGASTEKNNDLIDKTLASKWSHNRIILAILHYELKIAISWPLCVGQKHMKFSRIWGRFRSTSGSRKIISSLDTNAEQSICAFWWDTQ
jgi:hypothetical protein